MKYHGFSENCYNHNGLYRKIKAFALVFILVFDKFHPKTSFSASVAL